MPLFQPSNITPSSFAGVGGGTVAVADNVKITWQVNGNVAMTAYKIDIFDENNNSVYSSGILTDNTPFYPTDKKGNPQYFSYAPNSTWASWGLIDGNEYTLQITQYWGNVTDSDYSVTQFSQSAFITRTNPTLTITTESGSTNFEIINIVSQSFTAIYTQEQNDSIDWVRWKFYHVVDGEDVLLDDTGAVNTQVLAYNSDNMQSGNNYKIVCIIQTEKGVQVTDNRIFKVEYSSESIEGQFSVNCVDKASNLLRWGELSSISGDNIQGVSNDNNYSFENGRLVLPQGSTVTWDTQNDGELNIPTDWTLAWKGQSIGLNNGELMVEHSAETEVSATLIPFSAAPEITKVVYDDVNDIYYGFKRDSFDIVKISGVGTSDTKIETATSLIDLGIIHDIAICAKHSLLIVVGFSVNLSGFCAIYDLSGGKLNRNSALETAFTGNLGMSVISVDCSPTNDLLAMRVSWATGTFGTFLYSISDSGFALLSNSTDIIDDSSGSLSFNKDSDILIANCTPTTDNGSPSLIGYRILNSTTLQELFVQTDNVGINGLFSPTDNIYVSGNYIYRVDFDSLNYIGEYSIDSTYPVPTIMPLGFYKSSGILLFIGIDDSNISGGFLREYIGIAYLINDGVYTQLLQNISIIGAAGARYGYANGMLFASSKHFQVSINTTFSFSNHYDNKTIYHIGVEETNADEYFIELTSGSYRIYGQQIVPSIINLSVTVKYLQGYETKIEETYLTTNSISIIRNANVLNILKGNTVIAQFTIPYNITFATISLNSQTAKLFCGGEVYSVDIESSVYSQESISSVVLSGEQICNWVYILLGNMEITENTIPDWYSETRFLTNFQVSSLNAGQLEQIYPTMRIYRENVDTGEIKGLYSCEKSVLQIRDFSWIAKTSYTYYGYAIASNVQIGERVFNNAPFYRTQPYYLLIATTQDKEQPNVYHVVHYWRFGNNIESGSVSNNNAPNFLNNFTGYRLKQPTARKGKSGTLTALLSNVVNGEYKDTTLQMENLYALSECNNPLFLKDMKGNLYMVTVSSAITQTINTKSAHQEVRVSIPWEEIGSSDGVSIIQVPTDEGWIDDNAQLAEVRLEVDEETGMLRVVYPYDYNYATTFGLVRPDLYATTKDGVEAADLEIVDGAVILNGNSEE